MKKIIRNILKEETELKKKVLNVINKFGIVKATKVVGGYENIVKILGPEFFTKENKIILINKIAKEYGRDGVIFFGDYDIDVELGKDVYNDGSYDVTFIDFVGNDTIYWTSWSYDEDGHMFDEATDEGEFDLIELSDYLINELLEILTNKFL